MEKKGIEEEDKRAWGLVWGNVCQIFKSWKNATRLLFSKEPCFKQVALICFCSPFSYSEVPSYPAPCSPSGPSLILPFPRKPLTHS